MKLVVQEDRMGCGVACVASRLEISYKKALRLFSKPRNAMTVGYSRSQIVAALNKAGKQYTFLRTAKRKKIRFVPGDIVFARGRKYPHGHYVLKTKLGWMNSWSNFRDWTGPIAGFDKMLPGHAIFLI